MCFDKRGQGTIEYLMIQAAVLAVGVVAIVLCYFLFSNLSDPSKVAQDKSSCITTGIELKNYGVPFDSITGEANSADGFLSVKYLGKSLNCTATSSPRGDAMCKVTLSDSSCMKVYANSTHCTLLSNSVPC